MQYEAPHPARIRSPPSPRFAGRGNASHPLQLHLNRRAALDGLIHHAIALGELEQLVELLLWRVGVDIEGEADLREADRRVLRHAERAAKIEIALGRYVSRLERDVERGRYRLQRHARAGYQRLEQHVAGAKLHARAAGCRMQARHRQRAPGLDLAGDLAVVERALRFERDHRGAGIAFVAILDRRLHRAQCGCVHSSSPYAAGVSTTRPTILPARRSLSVSFTASSGRVLIGTGGMPVRFTRSSSSAMSLWLPT